MLPSLVIKIEQLINAVPEVTSINGVMKKGGTVEEIFSPLNKAQFVLFRGGRIFILSSQFLKGLKLEGCLALRHIYQLFIVGAGRSLARRQVLILTLRKSMITSTSKGDGNEY